MELPNEDLVGIENNFGVTILHNRRHLHNAPHPSSSTETLEPETTIVVQDA